MTTLIVEHRNGDCAIFSREQLELVRLAVGHLAAQCAILIRNGTATDITVDRRDALVAIRNLLD